MKWLTHPPGTSAGPGSISGDERHGIFNVNLTLNIAYSVSHKSENRVIVVPPQFGRYKNQ